MYKQRSRKEIHYWLAEGLEGSNIDLTVHATEQSWSDNLASGSSIIEVSLDECGRRESGGVWAADANDNSAPLECLWDWKVETLYSFCMFSWNFIKICNRVKTA